MSRRLSAILSIDVVGYSRMMERDETATLAALNALRKDLIDPNVARYGGNTVKLMGDGALVEFPSAVDAVRFAVAVQIAMRDRNAQVSEHRRMSFRIGINVGDIHGDGVNLAARLEALAEPGGICIHRSVRDQVRNKLPLEFDDLGEVRVKNIEQPAHAFRVILDGNADALAANPPEVAAPAAPRAPSGPVRVAVGVLLALVIAGLVWWQPWAKPTAGMALPDKPSIVVLPFANRTDAEDQTYFAEGFSTAVRTHLSKFPQILVIAGSTADTIESKPARAREIGEELGVKYVLSGSLERHGAENTINAELIDAETEKTFWAEQFDFPAEDPFTAQAELVAEIVSTLRVVIEAEEIAAAQRRPTDSPKAYDLYLRAEAAQRQLSKGGRQEAIRLLTQALELDPDFLDAHLELSSVHLGRWRFSSADDPDEARRLARHHAERALQLDQSDYRVHFRMGMLHLFVDHDHELAHAAFQRALSSNSNDADLLYNMGFLRSLMGEGAEAIAWNDKAKRINPRYPGWYNFNAAMSHFLVKDYEQALLLARTGKAAYAKALPPRRILIATLVEMGELDEAKREAEEYMALSPEFRLSTFRNTPWQKPADRDRVYGALRRAGIPD